MIWTILSAFLPVFAVIALGYAVRASGYLPREFWRGVNALNHRVLLPAFLISQLAAADFSREGSAGLAALSTAGTLALLALALITVFAMGFRRGAAAPVTAVAVQWNFVLTLALLLALAGPDTASLAAAVVAPGILLGAVITAGSFAVAQGARPMAAAGKIARDPMVLAAIAGLAANAAGLARVPLLTAPIDLVGAGALAVILLAMGAGLDFGALRGRIRPLVTAAVLRCLAGPVVFLGLAILFDVSGPSAMVLALAGAAPCAAFVYAVAADFEAETGLTAGMITLTVLCSALISPVAAMIAAAL